MSNDVRKITRWEREESSEKEISALIDCGNFYENLFANMSDEQYAQYWELREESHLSRKAALRGSCRVY